jgi:hypothetical protein
MSGKSRPIDLTRAAVALVVLIERRTGKPCPTARDIRGHTTLPERQVWWFVDRLRRHGLIDVEERGGHVQRQRRMRVFCGEWTDWTQRKPRRRPTGGERG